MKTIKSEEYTYDTKRGTTLQTRVIRLYTFDELNDDARDRVIADYMEERENDPYFNQWFYDAYENEIWECVRDLEKSVTGARVKWKYNRWYSCDFDCEYSYDDCYDPGYMERAKDTGYYASMDLCDAWNAHIARLNAIYHQYINLDDLLYYAEDGSPRYLAMGEACENAITLWYEELEKACEDVRNSIEYLLRAEWEYYTSEECARDDFEANEAGYECRTCDYAYYKNGGYTGRVYYHDSRKWYTADGEFYEQSNVNHACVSIVKAG